MQMFLNVSSLFLFCFFMIVIFARESQKKIATVSRQRLPQPIKFLSFTLYVTNAIFHRNKEKISTFNEEQK